MGPKAILEAQKNLDDAISNIEKTHNKRVTPAARMMLQAILLESMSTREAEWARSGVFSCVLFWPATPPTRKIPMLLR